MKPSISVVTPIDRLDLLQVSLSPKISDISYLNDKNDFLDIGNISLDNLFAFLALKAKNLCTFYFLVEMVAAILDFGKFKVLAPRISW